MMAFLTGVIVAALGGLAAYPKWREHRRLPMDAAARADAPGDFVTLRHGTVHYRFYGPENGPLAVCVHGLTTPSFVFEGIAERLVAQGYRVLTYDHFGRGYSDRPSAPQDRRFFTQNLVELLDALNVREPFDLVGYSMGGWVVTAFAADYPARIKKLILLAPAGMGHELGTLAKFCVSVPVVGSWLFGLGYARQHILGTEAERALPSSVPHIIDRQQKELIYRGFIPSVLASMRGALSATTERDHNTLRDAGTDVIAIWGECDTVIPLMCKDRLSAWNPNVTHHIVAGAGHGVTYTHTDDVVTAMDLRGG